MPSPLVVHRRLMTACTCLLTLLAALLVAGPSAAASAAKAPKAPRTFTSSIESLAPYVAQSSCDPHAKRGTRKLGRLLANTYGGTSWASTYACGTDGSTSEHYDGRAIDWMVSVSNKRQHADARAFLSWLLATDSFGDTDAMARRLGVMYVIYNNRMWGAWDGKWQDYNNCQSKKMRSAAYDNACHRTHVHISLSWNGARGRTTFWTGQVSATDYGPCRKKGHKFAPKWSHRNDRPCGRS